MATIVNRTDVAAKAIELYTKAGGTTAPNELYADVTFDAAGALATVRAYERYLATVRLNPTEIEALGKQVSL